MPSDGDLLADRRIGIGGAGIGQQQLLALAVIARDASAAVADRIGAEQRRLRRVGGRRLVGRRRARRAADAD